MARTPICRMPIKVRHSIHKDFCTCWNMKVLLINGETQMLIADGMTIHQLSEFLKTTDLCTSIYFSEPLSQCKDKIDLVLSYGIPVIIKTNQALPNELIYRLEKVPHSAIIVSMGFLDDSVRNSLDPGAGKVKPLREMMFLAKTLKVFVCLEIDYKPHLMSKLDLFEIVEMTKMLIGHIVVTFPVIRDIDRYDNHTLWGSVCPGYTERFKHHYQAHVPSRTWVIKDRAKKEFINALSAFIRYKKVTMEVLEVFEEYPDRIRHINDGTGKLPIGIKPFRYIKCKEDMFVECLETDTWTCPICGKEVF